MFLILNGVKQKDIQVLNNEIKGGSLVTDDDFEEMVAEMNDKNNRKSNLVIFGLRELDHIRFL